ncbi:FG-GAP repeat protein [Sorangium sp. So ce1504]|uniref:FG-GAP repeat protein n=1 Tax=Sorangium sp. So ce1504 TaxID=3133337 RepID=UPI003F5E1339
MTERAFPLAPSPHSPAPATPSLHLPFEPICDEFYGNGDRFGKVLRAGDYNNDGRADLAVSAPGKSLTVDVGHEGMVFALTSGGNFFDSDPRNFSSARSLRQGSDGVNDLVQANDGFGQ